MPLEIKYAVSVQHSDSIAQEIAERISQALRERGDRMPMIERRIDRSDPARSIFTITSFIHGLTEEALTDIVKTACGEILVI